MNANPAGDDILFERRGTAGLVTLNRPQALNAVTHAMVRALADSSPTGQSDDAVTRVVVTAAGGRAFSAGGDLRALYDLGRAGRHDEALAFWRDEYRLNAMIKRYRKPYVALIDGVVMGGGVGVSIHGSHRVAGDRFSFAMPEVGIGFFPDVGATWFLPRMPGELGTYCALTGERLDAADGVGSGIATSSGHIGAVSGPDRSALQRGAGRRVARRVCGAAGEGPVLQQQAAIDRLFRGGPDRGHPGGARPDRGGTWRRCGVCPHCRGRDPRQSRRLSLKIALAQLRRGRTLDFDECMRTEFRIVSRVVRGHDFYEGIRAVIIDKDQTPHWQPASLADVSEAEVARHFAPVPAELDLP